MNDVIDQFSPKIPAADWAAIGSFVRDAVRDSQPSGYGPTRHQIYQCTRFVHWAWSTAGLDLDRQKIFRPEVINNFVMQGCTDLKASSRATYRSGLNKIADALLTGPNRPARRAPISRGIYASSPYSMADQTRLRFWATCQRTDYRTFNAGVMLALGLGGGLTASEMLLVTSADLELGDHGVVVQVRDKRPRAVPILADWAAPLEQLLKTRSVKDYYLFSPRRRRTANPGLVSAFIEDCDNYEIRPNPQRLRATWVVRHLSAGIHPTIVAEAAGLTDQASLAYWWRMVPLADLDEERRLLHGSGPKDSARGGAK